MYIKNVNELLITDIHKDMIELINEGLRSADPVIAIKRNVELVGNKLRVVDEHVDLSLYERVLVLGIGKASFKMAQGIESVLEEVIDKGLVIMPKGAKVDASLLKKIKVFYGNHPYPSHDTIRSSLELIKLAKEANKRTFVIVLISGGGSALFEVLPKGISVHDLTKLNELLLKSGADIREVNTVRKHVSLVKGGQLLRYLNGAKVYALIISDVVGDYIEFIASGPTAPDTTTFRDAYEVLVRYGLWDKVPKSIRERIKLGVEGKVPETPKPGDPLFNRVRNYIVASNIIALRSIAKKAKELGYNPLILTSHMEGEAREVGKFIASVIRTVKEHDIPVNKPAALIMGGETTVTVRGSGVGGRNQELALSVAISIAGLRDVVFASFGTDGIDGVTDAAGAIVSSETMNMAKDARLNLKEYLENNDSYTLFKKLGHHLIITGATGTNVNDIAIALIR